MRPSRHRKPRIAEPRRCYRPRGRIVDSVGLAVADLRARAQEAEILSRRVLVLP
jgi:hypothetical protein